MSVEIVEKSNPVNKNKPSTKKAPEDNKNDDNKKNWKWIRDKHREKVRGKFIFHEVPGGTMKFPFKEFKGDKVERYELTDGQVYTLPLGVAKHLNKNCWYPQHHYLLDETGKPSMRVGKKVRRCSFQSLEFVDIEDLTPDHSDLVTASLL